MGEKTKLKLNEPRKAETGMAKNPWQQTKHAQSYSRLRTETDALSALDSRQTGLPFLRPHTLFIVMKMNRNDCERS